MFASVRSTAKQMGRVDAGKSEDRDLGVILLKQNQQALVSYQKEKIFNKKKLSFTLTNLTYKPLSTVFCFLKIRTLEEGRESQREMSV